MMDRITKAHIRHVFQHLLDFDNQSQLESIGLVKKNGYKKKGLIASMKALQDEIVGVFPDGDIVLHYQMKESELPNFDIQAPENVLITEGGAIPEPPKPPERPSSRFVREDGRPVDIINTVIPAKEKRDMEYYLRLFIKRVILFPIFLVGFPAIYIIAFAMGGYKEANLEIKKIYTEVWEMD